MKLVHRRPEAGTTDVEIVFGVLFLPLLAAASLVLAWIPGAWLPRCLLHASLGLPCPTCGASRGIRYLAAGRWLDAWRMQPLVVSLVFCAGLYCLYSFVVVLGKLPRLRLTDLSRGERRAMFIGAAGLVLANWAYLVWRGV